MVNEDNTQTKSVDFHPHYPMFSKNPELQNNNTSITQNNPNNTCNSLMIFHQNIRGLSHKSDELLQSILSSNSQVLCFSEHHMSLDEINSFHLNQYILGSQFCRQNFKHGGVSIFISTNLQFSIVDLSNYVKEKDLEICAIKIKIDKSITIIACVYRSPTGDFPFFINQMESLLNSLYTTTSNLVICGDFNLNFNENFSGPITRVHLFESVLATYNLHKTVNFSTRNLLNSKTTIDNIFTDINKLRFSTKPLINGLSDHDAQIIVLYDVICPSNKHQPT